MTAIRQPMLSTWRPRRDEVGLAIDVVMGQRKERMVTICAGVGETSLAEGAKKYGVNRQPIYGCRKHFGSLEPAAVISLRRTNAIYSSLNLDFFVGLASVWPLNIASESCCFSV